jgi:hypothetical protein
MVIYGPGGLAQWPSHQKAPVRIPPEYKAFQGRHGNSNIYTNIYFLKMVFCVIPTKYV